MNKWIKFHKGMTCPAGLEGILAQCLECKYCREIIVTPTKFSVLCSLSRTENDKQPLLFKKEEVR